MDVPTPLLEVLKCDNCQDYLSYSPVYLKHSGCTLCGRCYASENTEPESANRILQYEAAAKLLKFPCRYRTYGCQNTVLFSADDQEKPHEAGCDFRNYQCPIAAEVDCEWSGLRRSLLGHFQSCHPDHIAMNPCHLMYDITQFSVKTYITHCFDAIFLIHTKVCIATGKIYHAVRLLDNPEKVTQFKYTLDIKREELVISRPGKVVQQNNEGVDEKSAVVTNISSMLDFLNGFSGTIFTIKILKNVNNVPKSIQEAIKQLKVAEKSVENLISLKAPEKSDQPTTSLAVAVLGRPCRNTYKGCTFSDTEVKCDKHEEFFCPFRTWCWSCWTSVSPLTEDAWQLHLTAEHNNFTYQGATVFTITTTGANGRSFFVRTHIGLVNCRYIFLPKLLKLYIWSPSTSKLLKRYKCTLIVIETSSSNSTAFVLDKQYNETWDWYIKLEKENLPTWSNKFDVALQVLKQK